MIKSIQTEYDSYGIITFVTEQFTPLTCKDFVAAHSDKTKRYEIEVYARDIEIIIPGVEPQYKAEGSWKMPIDFNHSLPVYALVPGGWLPPPFVDPPVFLLDRNVIRYIEVIADGRSDTHYADAKWWLELIGDENTYISPFLYAFESGRQMIPDIEEFKKSYEEGVRIIRRLFPKAEIHEYKDEHFDAAFETITDVLKFHPQETTFLQTVAPLIRLNVAQNDLERVRNEIMEIATKLGLSYRSLPLLAALSCLYEDPVISCFNVARKLLKIGGGAYTNEKAYNVLSDMRGLLFYFAFRAIAESENVPPVSYVTADQAALLFGCGLNVTNAQWRGNRLFLTLGLSEFLFPRMTEGEREELARLIEKG